MRRCGMECGDASQVQMAHENASFRSTARWTHEAADGPAAPVLCPVFA